MKIFRNFYYRYLRPKNKKPVHPEQFKDHKLLGKLQENITIISRFFVR